MDCTVHGIAKSRTQLSDFHSLTHTAALLFSLVETLEMFLFISIAKVFQNVPPHVFISFSLSF